MKTKRIESIKDLTYKHGSVTLNELCNTFKVSKNTIRRDINELVKEGVVEKVYGGIKAKDIDLLPFPQREVTNKAAKMTIGRIAARFIKDSDVIFIDSGTTASQIMAYFPQDIACTVLTNSFDVIEYCTSLTNITLFVIGSMYKHKTRSFIDIQNEINISNFNVNKAFMATTGLSINNGLTNSDPLEYTIKRKICEIAEEIYVMVDSSKYDKPTLLTYCKLSEIDFFITDKTPPKKYSDYFKEENITVIIE